MSCNVYFFVIDETVIVDEDVFEMEIAPVLEDFSDEIKKEDSFLYFVKQSPFQKKIFWKLNNLLESLTPLVWIQAIDKYCPDEIKKDCNNKRIALELMKYANYVDSQWDINHIITYIDNEDSDAFKIAENERKKGNIIIDLKELVEKKAAYRKEKIARIVELSQRITENQSQILG